MRASRVIAIACSVVPLALACGAEDEIDRTLDCHGICDNYQDCFDSDYDVSECRDRCEDEGDRDANF